MKSALDRLIRFQLDYPWRVFALVAIITVAAMVGASRVQFDFTIENLFPEDDPDVDAYFKFREEFEREDDLISLAYDAGDPFSFQSLTTVQKLTTELSKIDGMVKVTSLTNVELFQPGKDLILASVYGSIPNSQESLDSLKNRIMTSSLLKENLISSDGKTAAILLELDDMVNNHEGRAKIVDQIGEIIAVTDWKWYEAGIPVLRTRYVQYMLVDYGRFFVPVSIVLFGILFLLFRTIRGMLLPFSAVIISDLWVLGLMGASGLTINIVTYLVPILVLIIGVADSIHILVKFQEELVHCREKREAIERTVRKIGAAIMLTSITTAIGFFSLVSTNITMIRQFGAIVAVAVILAFLVSITFVPAMLMILKIPPKVRLQRVTESFRHRFLKWVVAVNNRRQNFIVVISSLLVITFIYYAMKIDSHSALMEDLSSGNQLYDDMTFMEERMGSVLPMEVIVTVESSVGSIENGIKKPEILRAIAKLQEKLSSIPEIGKTISAVDYLREMNKAFHEGDPDYYTIPETREIVAQYIFLQEAQFETLTNLDYSSARLAGRITDITSLRAQQITDEVKQWCGDNLPTSLNVELTGTTLMALKINQYLVNNLVVSFLIAFGVIFFSMLVLFRSIKLATVSMIPNFIPLLLMAGVMGFFEIKLRPTTAMTFAIAFGIAVDDTIHYLARFRHELFAHGGHYKKANEQTLLTTGKAIVSTSLVLSAGFFIMVSSNFLPSRDFGFLSAITMLGALLGDLFFLPTVLALVRPKIPRFQRSQKED